jgi:hypothetical protein
MTSNKPMQIVAVPLFICVHGCGIPTPGFAGAWSLAHHQPPLLRQIILNQCPVPHVLPADPQGPSFQVDGYQVRWLGWRFQVCNATHSLLLFSTQVHFSAQEVPGRGPGAGWLECI